MNRILPAALAVVLASCAPSPPTPDQVGQFAKAKSLYLTGDWKASRAALGTLLQQNGSFAAARLLSGKIRYLESDWPEAEKEFRAVLAQDSGNADARLWLCRTLLAGGRLDELKEPLNWLLTHDNENPQVTLLAASVAEVRGEYQDALEHYRTALLFRDEMGKALLNTARLYKRSLQNDEALRLAREAEQVLDAASYLRPATQELIRDLSKK